MYVCIHGLTDQRFRSYEKVKKMDRFLDSLKRHVVFSARNSHTARKMGENGF